MLIIETIDHLITVSTMYGDVWVFDDESESAKFVQLWFSDDIRGDEIPAPFYSEEG